MERIKDDNNVRGKGKGFVLGYGEEIRMIIL